VFTALVAVFVSRPFCHWVCPVDTTEQVARSVRVRLLRLVGRRPAPRERRPVLLPMARPRPAQDPLRRVRNGALTAVGLLCALLVLGHLHDRFAGASQGVQENLMSDTFVSAADD
jgi:polyferredoxin